jgi:hypothetical protein
LGNFFTSNPSNYCDYEGFLSEMCERGEYIPPFYSLETVFFVGKLGKNYCFWETFTQSFNQSDVGEISRNRIQIYPFYPFFWNEREVVGSTTSQKHPPNPWFTQNTIYQPLTNYFHFPSLFSPKTYRFPKLCDTYRGSEYDTSSHRKEEGMLVRVKLILTVGRILTLWGDTGGRQGHWEDRTTTPIGVRWLGSTPTSFVSLPLF